MKQALILAAGLGTRLKPLTDTMPKALVPVAGKPLLQHQIERLAGAGYTRIVVNVHHFGQQIIDFVNGYMHSQTFAGDVDVLISDERACLLDTGGAIRHAAPLFDSDSPVLVHNVDILHTADLQQFFKAASGTDALLLVSKRETSRYLIFNAEGKLVGWKNVKTGEMKGLQGSADGEVSLAFSGIHILSPALVQSMQQWPPRFSIIDFYLEQCRSKDIRAWVPAEYRMLDVGKVDTLAAAETFYSLTAPK